MGAAVLALVVTCTFPAHSQGLSNSVYVSLGSIDLQTTNEDSIQSGPVTWDRWWFANMINTPDGAGPVMNARIDVRTTLPLSGFRPDDPAIFSSPAAGHFRWTYAGPLDETVSAQGWARPMPATEVSDLQYSGARLVSPQLLTAASTLQNVTFTLTIERALPADRTFFGIFIGTPRIASGGFDLVKGEIAGYTEVPGWTSSTDGSTASWWTDPGTLKVGDTFTFQATVKSTKSAMLLGSPLFKPEVFFVLSRNSPAANGTPNDITIQHPTEPMSVDFHADNAVQWNPGLTEASNDFHLNPIVSEVTSAPPFRVKVPATVRIEPEALNAGANGVITAFIQLNEPYRTGDIQPHSVRCQGAPAISARVSGRQVIAKFDRALLGPFGAGDNVQLSVSGLLADGALFEGRDTVRLVR
jgi:hypothetical protein